MSIHETKTQKLPTMGAASDETMMDERLAGASPIVASPAKGSIPTLVIIDAKGLTTIFRITNPEVTIGRSPTCDILVPDGRVSRVHTTLRYNNYQTPMDEPLITVNDLGSKNGTYLNGERIAHPRLLQPGDHLQVGITSLGYYLRSPFEVEAERKLNEMATTDVLTGLLNRRAMEQQFEREFERATRYNRPYSLLMVDIDRFKEVNDKYGHEAGDIVLKQTGRMLQILIRGHDLPARYGGEEFAIFCPEADAGGAMMLAERIRQQISEQKFMVGKEQIVVTVSVGIAWKADTLAELVRMADSALYRAKTEGRNRVVAHSLH